MNRAIASKCSIMSTTDVPASIGVIPAIDKVLIPSGSNLAVADFSGIFGGTTVEDGIYEFPTGAADWAGFTNNNAQMYNFSFPHGGKISFTALIPDGSTDKLYGSDLNVSPSLMLSLYTTLKPL